MLAAIRAEVEVNQNLLQSLAEINNSYQDIEDELAKKNPDLEKIAQANHIIGQEVVKHLPE